MTCEFVDCQSEGTIGVTGVHFLVGDHLVTTARFRSVALCGQHAPQVYEELALVLYHDAVRPDILDYGAVECDRFAIVHEDGTVDDPARLPAVVSA
jgi:hypothetical protein